MYAFLVYQTVKGNQVEKCFVGDSIESIESIFSVKVIAYLGLASKIV